MKQNHHILYSFRRCPYAMRARMALYYAGIVLEHREIELKNKPQTMLDISPKGTVPVLQTLDGQVIDESIDVMHWALTQHDPSDWLSADTGATGLLIAQNDGPFKHALDRYKYPNRYPDEDTSDAFKAGAKILEALNHLIEEHGHLVSQRASLADFAIFPFIRQFVNANREKFKDLKLKALSNWLDTNLNSALFKGLSQITPKKCYKGPHEKEQTK